MYIGSTDSRGLMHCLWEILDNSVDEALGGWCTRIDMILRADGSVEVHDDGRGIPVDVEPRTRLTGVEVVMTKLHAGGKFGGGSYTASGGLHGVGASVVNALSSRLDVEVDRDARVHLISFRRGVPGVFDGDGPDSEFTKKSGLRQAGSCPRAKTGTRVRFWPDTQIFTADAGIDLELVYARAQQTTFLVPGLMIVVRDERDPDAPVERTFAHRGGIAEFAEHLSTGEAVSPVLRLAGAGNFTETVPVLDKRGHMVPTEVERELVVDVALRWGNHYDTEMRSFVNIVATPKGGTHVAGFERALVKTLNDYATSAKVLRASEGAITKEDALEGATAVITVRLAEPQFEGQTKEILGTPAASRIVAGVVSKELHGLVDQPAARGQARGQGRGREGRQRHARPGRGPHPPGRAAAQERPGVVLDAGEARGLPQRGPRAHRAVHRRGQLRAGHREARPGLRVPGPAADPRQDPQRAQGLAGRHAQERRVRGDHPGPRRRLRAHLRHRGPALQQGHPDGRRRRRRRAHPLPAAHPVPPLHAARCSTEGRVYSAVPPLHRVEVIASGGRRPRSATPTRTPSCKATLAELTKAGRRWKDPQRYKGLGEMDASQLRETTMEPGKRTLRRVRVEDAHDAATVFDLLMGSDVAPRKEFIVAGSAGLDRERIDA